MKTSQKEYNELLYVINDPNNLTDENVYYRIPADEPVYKIDLETRDVEAPEFLSVLEDHNAEVVWFKVDRFFDDVDLFGATCWIQYKNALNESYVCVTIPKVIKESNHDVLYIPWPICSPATKASGNVSFSFQFFKIGEDKKVHFSLHTKPATSKVLFGLHVDLDEFLEGSLDDSKIDPQYSEFMKMLQQLTDAYSTLSKDYELYWLEA